MARPTLDVADVFRRSGDAYRQAHGASLSTAQRRVMRAIETCRTAALGGHVEQCDHCEYRRISYNSCRNRHCPKCQALARAAWIEDRQAELLDTQYFHVVFTVPEAIAALAAQNKARVSGQPRPAGEAGPLPAPPGHGAPSDAVSPLPSLPSRAPPSTIQCP
jgi:hypothetical protein